MNHRHVFWAVTGLVLVSMATAPPATASAPLFCAPASLHPLSGGPGYPAVADLNGDGFSDVVVPINNASLASVFLGDGAGGFQQAPDIPTTAAANDVVVADFNADGDLDLAFAITGGNCVSVHFGDGLGGFNIGSCYPVDASPEGVATGDLNGDGALDLVSANKFGHSVSVLLGSISGTFSAQVSYDMLGRLPRYAVIADLDSDGILDVATANGHHSISVLIGTGGGVLSSPVDYPGAENSHAIKSADFDMDGHSDVAIGDADSSDVSVFLNTGTGAFATQGIYPSGPSPRSLAIADFDGDGSLDIAAANFNAAYVSILHGLGAGSFSSPTNFPAGPTPSVIAAGLFNSDSAPDLIVASAADNTMRVFLNGCQPAAGCSQVPEPSCRTAPKSTLHLRDDAEDSRDKLTWKWLKGEETMLEDLGLPTGTTTYSLCLYSGTSSALVSIPAGSAWQTLGSKGFRFKDSSGALHGAQKVLLESGATGKAKMLVKGKGSNLPDDLVPALTPPVTAQLINDDNGICFESTFDSGDVIKNEPGQFKAKIQ